jgi:biopolymer transport protein ExbD
MRRLFRRRGAGPDDDWEFELPVSMIDVVFLLLVFFMCAARFRSPEMILKTQLPKDGPRKGPVRNFDVSEILIKIFWADTAGMPVPGPTPGGEVAIVAGRTRCEDLNDLARRLAVLAERHPDMPVVIDARKRVPFRYVLGAVDACKRACVGKVRLRAPAVDDSGDDWWQL